jgi:hypothetical protein
VRLPRWLVVFLLSASVLAVLGAAASWWVTWPERTAREFVKRLQSGREDSSWKEMVIEDKPFPALRVIAFRPPENWAGVKPQSRSMFDLCFAQQRYDVSGDFSWGFTVKRSKVLPSIDTLKDLQNKVFAEMRRQRNEHMERDRQLNQNPSR